MKKTVKKLVASLAVFSLTVMTALPAYAVNGSDEENPSDVEGLTVTALDGAANLSWDEATDNVGIAGYQVHYGISSVSQPGDSYDSNKDVGDITEYVIPDLENGTTYYFSVIAYDEEGNESIAWATEVSVAPEAGGGDITDTDAPQVAGAEAMNNVEVKVIFSEDVVIPDTDPQFAFTIENDDTLVELVVEDAVVSSEKATEVILTTVVQEEGATYKITVGIDIEDKAGNPIISGTSDTALFEGSAVEKAPEDVEGPAVVSVEIIDNTHVLVNFNETIILNIDPSENFVIMEEDDDSRTLLVLGVVLGFNSEQVEDSSAIITTSAQEDISYVVVATDLEDVDGNEIDPLNASGTFQGVTVPDEDDDDDGEDDLIPPKDVANFLAEKVLEGAEYMVKLTWDIPEENIENVMEQIIYMSQNLGADYNKEASLEPEVTEYEVDNLTPGEYWFKITQKDAAGNESDGVVKKMVLPEVGPEMLGMVLLSLGLGRIVTRRKRRK